MGRFGLLFILAVLSVVFVADVSAQVSFIHRRDFPSGSGSTNSVTLTAADFNGDDILDLATAHGDNTSISILLGDGYGGFTNPRTFAAGSFPFFLVAKDLNNDGALDLVVANFLAPQISVLFGDGEGNFSEPIFFPVGNNNTGIVAEDFNGDRNLDLATANFGPYTPIDQCGMADRSVSILLGDGKGNFTPAPQRDFMVGGRAPEGILAGDFNNDRNLDLVTLNYCSHNISLLLGNGDGTFRPARDFALSLNTSPAYGVVGKFKGDDNLDLITANWEPANNVSVLLGNGQGSFAVPVQNLPTGSAPRSIAVGDFDSDDNLDLAVSNAITGDVSILLGNGSGSFRPFKSFPVVSPWFVTVGDFNSDGIADLATSGNGPTNNISVLYGDGSGNFGNYFRALYPSAVAIGDVNGDARPDMVAANIGSNDVWVLLGDGLGGFSYGAQPTVGTRPVSVIMGPLLRQDVDRRVDFLATANFDSNNVSVLLKNARGEFDPARNFPVGINPNAVVAGDFDGDGNMDLATANLGSNTVSVLLGDGRGGYSAARNFAVGSGPWHLNVGDFNGDGKLDLVVVNSGSNTISVLLNDGRWATPSGGFAPARNFAVGTTPRHVSVGDFNGDRKPDLVVANSASDSVSVLLNDGQWTTPSGGFAAARNFDVGSAPLSISIGDFNRDNKLDLAVTNFGSDRVSILLGDGTGRFTANSPRDFFVGLGPLSIAIGDFDGDGRPDLAFANFSSSTISYLMNNTP